MANRKLTTNPTIGITIKLGKGRRLRPKGFTDVEAQAILSAALHRDPGKDQPLIAAAKRWVPWLCAFSGARVGEIAQLRKQDIRREGDICVLHITPEAGTVKTDEARHVVLHPQLVELGFLKFVEASADGPLFFKTGSNGEIRGPWRTVKNRLVEFARTIVSDRGVAPNHGWRHRFKSVGRELSIDTRILDSIQGHAPRNVSDKYGDVTLKLQLKTMKAFPRYKVERNSISPENNLCDYLASS